MWLRSTATVKGPRRSGGPSPGRPFVPRPRTTNHTRSIAVLRCVGPGYRNFAMIGVAQLRSINDININFEVCERLAARAKGLGVSLLCFPECFAFMGEEPGESLKRSAEVIEASGGRQGPVLGRFQALALHHNLWLSLGGFHENNKEDPTKMFNTHLIVDNKGEIKAIYRKIHLFQVSIPNGPNLNEWAYTSPGQEIVVCDSPVGRLGLSICYDLRFPEMYRALAKAGAEVLLVPSAFTVATGKDHWEVLLRSRAIENQCYVVAAAQYGQHNSKRSSYGHSIIVDPWGQVVAQCSDEEGQLAVHAIDGAYVRSVRAKLPVWNHTAEHVYSTPVTNAATPAPK